MEKGWGRGAVCKDMPNGCQCVERSPAHSMRPGVEAIRRQMAIRSVAGGPRSHLRMYAGVGHGALWKEEVVQVNSNFFLTLPTLGLGWFSWIILTQ